jgi:hypothetical protein
MSKYPPGDRRDATLAADVSGVSAWPMDTRHTRRDGPVVCFDLKHLLLY